MLVQTNGLTKRYGSFAALSDLSLSIERGEVFGLLGPNGAGKTTLLRLLLGFLKPTSGSAAIAGLDCYHESVAVHKVLSYLPGDARLFQRLRGKDTLRFFAEVRPGGDFGRAMEFADQLELDVNRRVSQMSTGMRQKLALASVLSADVPLLILDEPTSNLDPTVRSQVGRIIKKVQAAGHTVIFSSHVMSEVEEICDRVVIMRGGRLVHTQVTSELRRQHRITAKLSGALPDLPGEFTGQVEISHNTRGDVVIQTPGELAPLLGWLATLPVTEVRIEPLGLRAVYDKYHAIDGDPPRTNSAEEN